MLLSRADRLPEKYTKDNYEFIYYMAMLGLTMQGIADKIGVELNAIQRWKRDIPAFRDAIERGQTDATLEVLKSTYRNCTGYYTKKQVANVCKGEVVITEIDEWHAPNPWLQARYLSLKAKDQGWSETQAPTVQNTTNIQYNISLLSGDELALLEQIQNKAITSGND
jgi:hypothetical protein